MKLLSICSIFLIAGLASAAPTEDGQVTFKGYLTTLLQKIGLMAYTGCEGDDALVCFNGGNCHPLPGPDNKAECICQDGFDGPQCKLTDFCADQDCSFSGICQNVAESVSEKGYICYCEPGFTGENCENEDLCYPNPCQHDGICLVNEDDSSVKCDCRDGYYGEICDIEDPCRTSPCANGGTCSLVYNNTAIERHCDCKPQFEGETCNKQRDCEPKCENEGICAETHNGKEMCFCPPGYSGIYCEHSVCEPSPCYNGGNCTVVDGKFHCQCPNGFSGDKCEMNVCVGHECNHGYCEVVSGQASCHCNDGWSGEDCNTPNGPTSSKPTTSNPTTIKPTTIAPPTTNTVKTSDKPDDPCDGVNCHHGDCVVNDDDEAECNCNQGWHGDDCNEKDDDPTTELPTTEGPKPTTSATPDPVPGPCNVITCKNHGAIQCQHCTGECIMDDNGDEQCVCDDGWHGDQCADEDQQ